MKKQFFRVKQLADQTFLGADKSEGLNHGELQKADHKVEYFRTSLTAISKKMPVQTPNQNENVDKRMKKYPEYQLGSVLIEQSKKGFINEENDDDERYLFQHVIKQCGQAQQELAREQAEHELKVENLVCTPIQEILENELPAILKHKRSLSKYILDKDSAKNRLQAVSKNGNQSHTLKEEHEEAELKVDQSRDALASEMFSMLRKENEISQYMLQILKLQRGFHESALKNLEKVIPELEKRIGDSSVKVVFGIPLEEHLRVTGRRIAYPLELCICILTELGLSEEGLFRVTGGAARVRRLKLSIDSGMFEPPIVDEYRDVHVIASTLKLYLRELPEPLLTKCLYKEWMSCISPQKSDDQKVQALKEVLKKLPTANRENLTYLLQFLAKLSKHPENKMSSLNIAICIAPNLLWSNDDEMNMHMNNCSIVNMILDLFIANADSLFSEDLSPHLRLTIGELLGEPENEFIRPVVHGLKPKFDPESYHGDTDSYGDSSSPKPQTRSKKKIPAPVPPSAPTKVDPEFTESKEKSNLTASYPSGSTTLNRSHKIRADNAIPKQKTSVGVNTDDSSLSSNRRRSLVGEPNQTENTHKNSDVPKAALVIDDPKTMADHKYVSQPSANIHLSKAKPVQALQITIAEKPPLANNALQKSNNNQVIDMKPPQPVAAPRSILPDTEKSTLRIENPLTKSLNSMESMEIEGVQIRKLSRDGLERASKPMIPERPASLRGVSRSNLDMTTDPMVHKTQCLVYSVANKQQPSIVNIQNRLSGHDTQIAEKEKFLGHQPEQRGPEQRGLEQRGVDQRGLEQRGLDQRGLDQRGLEQRGLEQRGTEQRGLEQRGLEQRGPEQRIPAPRLSLENKFNDINFNCDSVRERTSSVGTKPEVPSKPSIMKSIEKLNTELHEKFNGNSKPSHVRTRSDGNIIDINGEHRISPSSLHTPPSPRGLNKPTQPPPPPPTSTQRPKSEPDSTDL